jgi:exosortase/archaeosortase family protein
MYNFRLVMFYPVYKWSKRIWVGLIGIAIVYIINYVRLLAVIIMIHSFGRNMSFFAHAVIGRFIFFVLIIALYWQLMTKPTLVKIGENVKDA